VALVAFGAIAVTRVFDEERRAQAARAKAEASETSADGLMQFMLDDLFQKLADTSQLGLLGPIAERAEDHLEAKVAAGIPVDALRRADAALATGEVRRAEGELDKALVSCRTSLALLEDVDLDAAAARTKQSIHRAHDCIGDVLLAKGDAPGAVAEYERALAVTQTTDDPHSARNHVTQLLSIASAIIEIDPPRAQPFAERARVEATRLDDSALIAEAHRWLGQSIVQQDLPAAVEHMKLAVERYRRLAVGASGVDSTALARRASTTFELGEFTKFVDPAAGAALNEEALQAFVELMGREPANEKYRDWHRNALAAQVRRRRRTWAWRDLLSDEVQVRAAFASARHDTNDTPMRWAYFEEAIGMSHLHQGNSGAAVAHFLAAIEHGQTALAANPNAAPARRLMTVARTGLGEAFSTRRQWAEAAAALTPVLDLAAQGAQLEAHALEWPEHQFNAGVELVQVHRHTRDAAARTDAVRQALAAAKTLLAMAPTWRPREMPTAADATTPDAVLAAIEQALAKR
jgi:tetratricopeptide (TPR) repeat protein